MATLHIALTCMTFCSSADMDSPLYCTTVARVCRQIGLINSPRRRRASADLELRIEHRPPAGALEVAPEAELDLGAVERRRRQMAPERLDLEHREGVAGHPDHVI